MRTLVLLLAAASLAPLAGCSRAEAGSVKIGSPTPLGQAERTDRITYLGGATAALARGEDAWRHQKPADAALADAIRLVDLARTSATRGDAPVEAQWEGKAAQALAKTRQSMQSGATPEVEKGLDEVKLYLDQAQQAASIEY